MALADIIIPIIPLATVVLLSALLFIIFMLLFKYPLKGMNNNEIRRTIAIITTSFYFGTVAMAISGKIELNSQVMEIIDGLKWAFMTVVAFYFGARAVESVKKPAQQSQSAEERPQSKDEEAEQ